MFGESSDDANAALPPQTCAAAALWRRRGENAVLLQQQLEGFPLRMSGIDNSYKIDGDVLLVIHASIPPGVHRPTTDRPSRDRTTATPRGAAAATAPLRAAPHIAAIDKFFIQ
jgi:hypothetical protein